MGLRVALCVTAALALLSGCGGTQPHPSGAVLRKPAPSAAHKTRDRPGGRWPAVPSTQDATQPSGAPESAASLFSRPAREIRGYQDSVAAYLPGYGFIVQGWPTEGVGSSPPASGKLWLVDPATGQAKELMGKVAPNIEPAFVYAGGHWVLWGQKWDGTGGPISYYLYDLGTGVRRPFTDPFIVVPRGSEMKAALAGIGDVVISGDRFYLSSSGTVRGCDGRGIAEEDLSSKTSEQLVVDACGGAAAGSAAAPVRESGPLPLRLRGLALGQWTVSGSTVYFVVTPQGRYDPSLILSLNLADGSVRALAKSAGPVTDIAADAQVVAFEAGDPGGGNWRVFALGAGKRRLAVLGPTQWGVPTVSGPLVAYGEPGAPIYDAGTGRVYALAKGLSAAQLLGPDISWPCLGRQALCYATLDSTLSR